jgi:signal transduction histidine kinase
MNVKLRLIGFGLAVCLLAGLIGRTGYTAWQKVIELRENFAAVQSESYHRAERFEASLLTLNELLLRYDLRKSATDKSDFYNEGDNLKQVLKVQQSAVSTAVEMDLLKQIQAAFDIYMAGATNLLEETVGNGSGRSPDEVLAKAKNIDRILELTRSLKRVERSMLSQVVEASHRAVGGLQRLLLVLVLLVLILGLTATSLIYRVKLAPLRAQLVQSRAIIERQEKLASLGTLAAGVAHEIRNPLTAINVRLHGLKKSLVPNSSEHEDATVIGQEIRRLDLIVRNVLQFARPAEPRSEIIAADDLLTRVQALLSSQLEKACIQLSLVRSPALWVRVDPQQIDQVLINLVQNAAESIGRNGTITLRARSALMRLAGQATPAVILQVIDSGKGIPLKVRERLFDPFFTTKETGTGLGLSIAARIVEKHGGALQYQTEVDRGTTFGVVLPRVEKNPDEAQA